MPSTIQPYQDWKNNLLWIVFLYLIGAMLAGWVVQQYGQLQGLEYGTVIRELSLQSSTQKKFFIKICLVISHLATFILPTLAFVFFVKKSNFTSTLFLKKIPGRKLILIAIVMMAAAFPIGQLLYLLSQSLPLPDWAIEQENLVNQVISYLLYPPTMTNTLLNILVIALLPALGEEFVFRGIVQSNLEKGLSNPHLAIWGSALLFSFIHFQFQGFLARAFLGGCLGYLFYWTRNLWLPIIAHFFNNAAQIIWFHFQETPVVPAAPNWGLVSLLSLSGIIILAWIVRYFSRPTTLEQIP